MFFEIYFEELLKTFPLITCLKVIVLFYFNRTMVAAIYLSICLASLTWCKWFCLGWMMLVDWLIIAPAQGTLHAKRYVCHSWFWMVYGYGAPSVQGSFLHSLPNSSNLCDKGSRFSKGNVAIGRYPSRATPWNQCPLDWLLSWEMPPLEISLIATKKSYSSLISFHCLSTEEACSSQQPYSLKLRRELELGWSLRPFLSQWYFG